GRADDDAVFLGLGEDVAAAAELAHHDARRVADPLGRGGLVRRRVAARGGDVHAALVGERAPPDVGHVLVHREVRDLGDEAGGLGEPRQVGEATRGLLELEVGRDDAQVGVAAALAVAVDRPLDVAGAGAAPRGGGGGGGGRGGGGGGGPVARGLRAPPAGGRAAPPARPHPAPAPPHHPP